MKKVGKQVLFIETDENIPRAGEGAFLRLKDGTMLNCLKIVKVDVDEIAQ